MNYIKKDEALFGYEEDLEEKGILDWLRAHTSFMKPLHRCEGELKLFEGELIF